MIFEECRKIRPRRVLKQQDIGPPRDNGVGLAQAGQYVRKIGAVRGSLGEGHKYPFCPNTKVRPGTVVAVPSAMVDLGSAIPSETWTSAVSCDMFISLSIAAISDNGAAPRWCKIGGCRLRLGGGLHTLRSQLLLRLVDFASPPTVPLSGSLDCPYRAAENFRKTPEPSRVVHRVAPHCTDSRTTPLQPETVHL